MWEWINGKTENWEQKHIIEPGNEYIKNKIGTSLAEIGSNVWSWFVDVLPDLMGYGTMAAGAFVIVGSMVGQGGMMKPLAFLATGLIVSMCILVTN